MLMQGLERFFHRPRRRLIEGSYASHSGSEMRLRTHPEGSLLGDARHWLSRMTDYNGSRPGER